MCNQQGKNETQKVKLGQHCIVAVSLVTPVLVKKITAAALHENKKHNCVAI